MIELQDVKSLNVPTIQQIISSHPDLVNIPLGKNGFYLLHYACSCNSVALTFIKELIGIYPSAVQICDSNGGLSFHHACRVHRSEDVIFLLHQHYPEAIRMKDRWNRLPLHYVLMKARSEQMIRFFLNKYPNAAHEKDIWYTTPLHFAAKCQEVSILRLLIQEYPQALVMQEQKEYTPLQLACTHNASETIIRFLVHQNPLTVRPKEYLGAKSALLYTLQYHESEPVIEYLIEQYPTLELVPWFESDCTRTRRSIYQALTILLSNTVLEDLKIVQGRFGNQSDGMGQLGEVLEQTLPENIALKTLDFYSLHKWKLSNICMQRLASGLRRNCGLTNLCVGVASSTGIKFLAEALKYNKTLRILDIGCDGFGDTKLIAIVSALEHNETLREICINAKTHYVTNDIYDDIVHLLTYNDTLHYFSVDFPSRIRSKVYNYIARVASENLKDNRSAAPKRKVRLERIYLWLLNHSSM